MLPNELAEDCTGTINEVVASILEGKHPHGKIHSCAMLETYDETRIFIPVNIMEDAVKSVARKISEALDPGGTDSEALQGWIFKTRVG